MLTGQRDGGPAVDCREEMAPKRENRKEEGGSVGETLTVVGITKRKERWLQAVNKAYTYSHNIITWKHKSPITISNKL